jgi:hypothetical protein
MLDRLVGHFSLRKLGHLRCQFCFKIRNVLWFEGMEFCCKNLKRILVLKVCSFVLLEKSSLFEIGLNNRKAEETVCQACVYTVREEMCIEWRKCVL